MSEEDQNQPPVEVSFGILGAGNSLGLSMEFADGVQLIPPHVVQEMGGDVELQKLADGLKNVLFDEFMQGFYSIMTSRKVNQFQADFVANHFAPKIF